MEKTEDVGYLYLFLPEAGKAEAALTGGSMSSTTFPTAVTFYSVLFGQPLIHDHLPAVGLPVAPIRNDLSKRKIAFQQQINKYSIDKQ